MIKTYEVTFKTTVEGTDSSIFFNMDDVADMFQRLLEENKDRPTLAYNLKLSHPEVLRITRNYKIV